MGFFNGEILKHETIIQTFFYAERLDFGNDKLTCFLFTNHK